MGAPKGEKDHGSMDRVHEIIAHVQTQAAGTAAATKEHQTDHVAPAARRVPRLPPRPLPWTPSLLVSPPLAVVAGAEQQSLRAVRFAAAAKMNDTDVAKQIQQMVRFIRQEAEEKASEISVSAEEEFNIEKLQLVEAEKKKIRQEYERKEKQVEVRKKIEYSMQLNASRIKVLQAQDDLVNSMKEDAMKKLLNVSHNHHEYKNILKELIVQGLLRLKEPAVLLRCRKEDHHHVESVLHSAKHEYASKANVHEPEILVDHNVYLPPAPSHHDIHAQFCSGGVVLASRDGKIVCENTLDARLEVVFRKKLPEIRKLLFGQVAA